MVSFKISLIPIRSFCVLKTWKGIKPSNLEDSILDWAIPVKKIKIEVTKNILRNPLSVSIESDWRIKTFHFTIIIT